MKEHSLPTVLNLFTDNICVVIYILFESIVTGCMYYCIETYALFTICMILSHGCASLFSKYIDVINTKYYNTQMDFLEQKLNSIIWTMKSLVDIHLIEQLIPDYIKYNSKYIGDIVTLLIYIPRILVLCYIVLVKIQFAIILLVPLIMIQFKKTEYLPRLSIVEQFYMNTRMEVRGIPKYTTTDTFNWITYSKIVMCLFITLPVLLEILMVYTTILTVELHLNNQKINKFLDDIQLTNKQFVKSSMVSLSTKRIEILDNEITSTIIVPMEFISSEGIYILVGQQVKVNQCLSSSGLMRAPLIGINEYYVIYALKNIFDYTTIGVLNYKIMNRTYNSDFISNISKNMSTAELCQINKNYNILNGLPLNSVPEYTTIGSIKLWYLLTLIHRIYTNLIVVFVYPEKIMDIYTYSQLHDIYFPDSYKRKLIIITDSAEFKNYKEFKTLEYLNQSGVIQFT